MVSLSRLCDLGNAVTDGEQPQIASEGGAGGGRRSRGSVSAGLGGSFDGAERSAVGAAAEKSEPVRATGRSPAF